jgi:hypothetical protein
MSGFRDKGARETPTAGSSLPHFHGHRERLKTRFQDGGTESLPDYELLELVLFQALPRRDTKPLAKALLARFGSFSEVLSAPKAQLLEVPGIGDGAVHQLKLIMAAAQRFGRDRIKTRALLDTWSAVLDYCRSAMAYEAIEQFRIVLDAIGFSFIFNDLDAASLKRPRRVPHLSLETFSLALQRSASGLFQTTAVVAGAHAGILVASMLHGVFRRRPGAVELRNRAGAGIHVLDRRGNAGPTGDTPPDSAEVPVLVRLARRLANDDGANPALARDPLDLLHHHLR